MEPEPRLIKELQQTKEFPLTQFTAAKPAVREPNFANLDLSMFEASPLTKEEFDDLVGTAMFGR